MRTLIPGRAVWTAGVALLGLAGCATVPAGADRPPSRATPPADAGVVRANYADPEPKAGKGEDATGDPKPENPDPDKSERPPGTLPLPRPTQPVAGAAGGSPPEPAPAAVSLPELTRLTLDQNPRLAEVGWAVETARGRAVQAGLYPNPTVNITGNELGDRTGPGGIWTTPLVSQELVTADKLQLSRAAALKEVDQAALTVISERYRLFTEVRQNFFEVAVLQRRVEVLTELVRLADQSRDTAERLKAAKEVARLDVVQLEVDLERYRADLEATRRSIPAAVRRLAASVGVQNLPPAVAADVEATLPDYDLDRLREYVVGVHPDVRSAQIGVERARLVLRRAEVEPIPNLTVSSGYTRQNQNKSNDWDIGVSAPIPLWNKNQGNIRAARGAIGEAANQVGRVQFQLLDRLSAAFTTYAAARERAARYKAAILPRAEETYQLSLKAYQGGQFEYLRVLQAQRAVGEARLEYLRSLGEMWRSASEIAGLMLEDEWPPAPAAAPQDDTRKQP